MKQENTKRNEDSNGNPTANTPPPHVLVQLSISDASQAPEAPATSPSGNSNGA